MRFCTPAEVLALAAAIEPRYRALIVFDAFCGLRLSELAGLQRQFLDLDAGTVRVVHNAVEVRGEIVWGSPKTKAGRRTIPVPHTIVELLRGHLERFVDSNPTRRCSAARTAACCAPAPGDRVLLSGRDAGIERLRPHDLRHTAVALWIAAARTRSRSPRWAGHTSVSVVLDRYGHLYDGHEAGVLDQLDELLGCRPYPTSTPRGSEGTRVSSPGTRLTLRPR